MSKFYHPLSLSFIVKKLLFIFLLLGITIGLHAQQTPPKTNTPPPLLLREVSGIVKDTTDVGLPGTTVRLTSDKDTLVMSTNPDGIFVFKNVKSATYTISVNSIGFKPIVAKYKQNDAIPRIVMDPIIMKADSKTLDVVVINGAPSITYKTDTVEYKASDYIVRENATVDELLKKMEGMEVGTDGSVVHQGNTLTKAKINGKTYLGGDVATAIQNLPAEIVEKIQVVDDYGDQAARTGVKDGDPEKILNIVTKSSKSVGNSANIAGGIGNDERYEGSVFATRLNGNQTIGINARLNNTINGVANSGGNGGGNGGGGGGRGGNNGGGGNSGGSGGTTTNGNAAFSFRDQLSKKIKINANYRHNFSNVNSINTSESLRFVPVEILPSTTPRTYETQALTINSDSEGNNDSKTHNFNFELEADLDSNNYMRFNPTINYTSAITNSLSKNIQKGAVYQNSISANSGLNKRPSLEAILFYQHIFTNRRRNISLQLNFNSANQESESDRNQNTIEYNGATEVVKKQLLTHRLVERDNIQSTYRASLTYVEPINLKSQLEFNGQINYNGYDNEAITSDILSNGNFAPVDSLSNIYDYSFMQSRIALNYRYGINNSSKVKFSIGVTGVPALLSGTKVSLGTTTHRSSFNLIPIARFQYQWSRQHSIQINYSGNATEPSFDQIQPVRDLSNPQSPVIGNPNLKATFNHSINSSYNNYIANAKLNYSVNLNATFIDNSVIRNSVPIIQDGVTAYETRFINASGVYRVGGNYSISKQLSDRKYNLSLNGSVNHNHNVAMARDVSYTTSSWNMNNRFGPRINPNEWIEVNPNVGYSFIKSTTTQVGANGNLTKTLSLNIDGKFIAWQSWIIGYSASKNFVSGISANVTSNPFVVNSYLQKELWKRRATLTFQAFDILNQNNFVARSNSDDGGYTDTKTNALSRYFIVRASVRLQKWTGARSRNGQQMMRRGDGSFMQN